MITPLGSTVPFGRPSRIGNTEGEEAETHEQAFNSKLKEKT